MHHFVIQRIMLMISSRAVEDQFLRQNTPNEDIQHGMQQLAESFNEIQSLKIIIASLKRQIKQLSLGEEIHTDVDRRYQPHWKICVLFSTIKCHHSDPKPF